MNGASFVQRISHVLSKVDYREAVTDLEREEIFKLRYEAYMRERSIDPHPSRQFSDAHDESDNCWVFGVYYEDELAASVRIHKADARRRDCPSLKTFYDILNPALASGKTVVDSTRFVVSRELAARVSGLHYVTLRLCWMAVEHFRANHFLAAIRPEHQAFYKRTFQHKAVCPPRAYAMLNCPISLMSVSYDDAVEWVYERYPFFRSNKFERRMLFGSEAVAFEPHAVFEHAAAGSPPPVWVPPQYQHNS